MPVTLDIQRKYHNNKVATDGYIIGEIRQQDCMEVEDSMYIATIPEGAILKGYVAYLIGGEDDEKAKIDIELGINDCVLCDAIKDVELNNKNATCKDVCDCVISKEPAIVKVTIKEAPKEASIMVLFNVITPEHIICSTPPMKLCTATVLLEPCKDCCDTTCGE